MRINPEIVANVCYGFLVFGFCGAYLLQMLKYPGALELCLLFLFLLTIQRKP